MNIREATPADVPAIRRLERSAGEQFRDIGMASIADDDPPPAEILRAATAAGRVWVADDPAVAPDLAGWLWLERVGVNLHIEQVSVHPSVRGRRVGSALVEFAVELAVRDGHPAVTLTAFADVPWNGPLYRNLGFSEIEDSELSPELRRIRRRETDAGLDVRRRIAMSRLARR